MASLPRSGKMEQEWSEHEHSVFQLVTSFKPPFYVKLIGGFYSDKESECFSVGDEYIVLQKLRITGVVATVGRADQSKHTKSTNFIIPKDYDGQFVMVNDSKYGGQAMTLKSMLSDRSIRLPLEVRLADSRAHHGETFLSKLPPDGKCTLTLLEHTTDDYFMAKTQQRRGGMALIFSTEATLNVHVKKTSSDAVNDLEFNVKDLNHDIFVHPVGTPLVLSKNINDLYAPRRPVLTDGTHPATISSEKTPPPIPRKYPRSSPSTTHHSASSEIGAPGNSENRSWARPMVPSPEKPSPIPRSSQKPSPKPRQGTAGGRETSSFSYEITLPGKTPEFQSSPISSTSLQDTQPVEDEKSTSMPPPPRNFNRDDRRTRVSKERVHIGTRGDSQHSPSSPPPYPSEPNPGARNPSTIPPYLQKQKSQYSTDEDEEYDRRMGEDDASVDPGEVGVSVPHIAPPLHILSPERPPPSAHQPEHPPPQAQPQANTSGSDEDDDDDLGDYEEIDDEGSSDYEPIESPSLPTSPSAPNQNQSKFGKLVKKVNVRFRKATSKETTKKHDSSIADFADDELTEDPYRELHLGKKSFMKKTACKRERNDPLPMPLESGPSYPVNQPTTPIHPMMHVPMRNQQNIHVEDDDDSDLSDYEQVDDDMGSSSGSAPVVSQFPARPLSFPSRPPPVAPPTANVTTPFVSTPPPVESTPADRKVPIEVQLTPARSPQPKVGRVVPIPAAVRQDSTKNAVEFPENLTNLSVNEIANTLRKLKIPDPVIDNFQEAQIDGDIFVCLTNEMLDQLGVGPLHQLKILKFKSGWRPNDS